MKKATKGIAAGAVAVCILAGMAGSPKKAESIELSIPFSRDEYDINTEIPVTISVSPEGSAIDDLEYFMDSSSVSFADAVINTGITEGDYSFYVRAGDVESNVLSIHVVDITARNEAAQKAEEERLAKEAEERKASEEQAAREAEEKAAVEQAAREAEEQKAAEEQTAKEAEKKAVAEQTVSEPVSDAPEADPAAAPQLAEEPVQIVEEPVQVIPANVTAYLPATGKKYHKIKNCGKMNPNNAVETTVSEAESKGYGRCSKCW